MDSVLRKVERIRTQMSPGRQGARGRGGEVERQVGRELTNFLRAIGPFWVRPWVLASLSLLHPTWSPVVGTGSAGVGVERTLARETESRSRESGLGGRVLGGRGVGLQPPRRGRGGILQGRGRGPKSSPLASPLLFLPSQAPVQRRSRRLPRLPNCSASFCGRKGLSDVVAAAATQDSAPSS